MEKKSSFPIKKVDVENLLEEAGGYVKFVSYAQSDKAKKKDVDNAEIMSLVMAATSGTGATSETMQVATELVGVKKRLTPNFIGFPEKINFTFIVLQNSIALGLYMKNAYIKASGLETLQQQRDAGSLGADKYAEFEAKQQTAACVFLFTMAYYGLYEITHHRPDDMSTMNNKFQGIPEININNPLNAVSSSIFYYGKYVAAPDFVNSEDDLVALTALYFESIIEEVYIRKDSLKFTESFINQTYQLEGSEFSINGWSSEIGHEAVSVEFNEVEFSSIVGNKEAKHNATRLAGMLMSYDPVVGKNPFNEFGGFPKVAMGFGPPGTGKSMQIAAIATELKRKCDWLGMPFLFHPLPDNIISTFQGGTAERAMEWFRPLNDKTRIIYAPIDDAENNLQERSQQGVSAGVKENIGVFLRNTEGAYAKNYGNSIIHLYTNLPEQVDKAVLSRIQQRAGIYGAITPEDFMDQNHIWLNGYNQLDSSFVNFKQPAGYEYMSDQGIVSSIMDLAPEDPRELIQQGALLEIFEKVSKNYKPDMPEFFGHLFAETKRRYNGFTSREVRNVQKIVGSIVMDFDFPEEWWKDEVVYFKQSYENKVQMLREQIKVNMGKLKFNDLMLQESLKYINNFIAISDTEEERAVETLVAQMMRNSKAQNLFAKKMEEIKSAQPA